MLINSSTILEQLKTDKRSEMHGIDITLAFENCVKFHK